MHSLRIKVKWPGTGADEGVLRAWWLVVDVVGKPEALDGSLRMPAVSISTSGTPTRAGQRRRAR
jgi:hypothetical protein